MKRFEQYDAALAVPSRAFEQDLANEFVRSGVIYMLRFQCAQARAHAGPLSAGGGPAVLVGVCGKGGASWRAKWLAMRRESTG